MSGVVGGMHRDVVVVSIVETGGCREKESVRCVDARERDELTGCYACDIGGGEETLGQTEARMEDVVVGQTWKKDGGSRGGDGGGGWDGRRVGGEWMGVSFCFFRGSLFLSKNIGLSFVPTRETDGS